MLWYPTLKEEYELNVQEKQLLRKYLVQRKN
jgi:hypothetical protein